MFMDQMHPYQDGATPPTEISADLLTSKPHIKHKGSPPAEAAREGGLALSGNRAEQSPRDAGRVVWGKRERNRLVQRGTLVLPHKQPSGVVRKEAFHKPNRRDTVAGEDGGSSP